MLTEPTGRSTEGVQPPAARLAVTIGKWADRQFEGVLKPIGLRPRHLWTLRGLRGGPLSQQGLGDVLGIDATQLVGLLNDLEAEGLVERRRDPLDRRRHNVEISALGCAKLTEADRALADVDDRMMTGLSPGDRARLVELMSWVAEHGAVDECTGKDEPCGSLAAATGDCPGAG